MENKNYRKEKPSIFDMERPEFPKRAVITGGMPYGNKKLHFGHIGGVFVQADATARFLRDRIGAENDGTHFVSIGMNDIESFHMCALMLYLRLFGEIHIIRKSLLRRDVAQRLTVFCHLSGNCRAEFLEEAKPRGK